MEREPATSPQGGRGWLPAFAFGATLAIWMLAYVLSMPGIGAAPWLLLGSIAFVLLMTGILAGRTGAAGGIAGGVALGSVITAINLLILGSMGSGQSWSDVVNTALPWVGGFFIAAAVLCTAGIIIGNAARGTGAGFRPRNWTAPFALVVAANTLLLLTAGGVVTGLEAGLAVPDWLTTFKYPMVLYPLELMKQQPGVYFEHFHRLWGLLVGLSTIVLTIQLFRFDRRGWVKGAAVAVLIMVIIQGVMGGTRITATNITLAIVHGVFGQVLFALLVCLAAFTTPRWVNGQPARTIEKGRADYMLSASLVGAVLLQIALGAVYRHLNADPDISHSAAFAMINAHMGLGILIAIKLLVVGIRAWVKRRNHQPLSRLGLVITILTPLQIALGFVAYIMVEMMGRDRLPGDPVPALEVLFTSAHQVLGAMILGSAALLLAWTKRLVAKPPISPA